MTTGTPQTTAAMELRYFDYAKHFSGHEAASLIFGINPAESKEYQIAPLLRVMKEHYKITLRAHIDFSDIANEMFTATTSSWGLSRREASKFWTIQEAMLDEAREQLWNPRSLHSWRMTSSYSDSEDSEHPLVRALNELDSDRFDRWLQSGTNTEFEWQLFDRVELQRWIAAMGQVSIYRFDDDPEPDSDSEVGGSADVGAKTRAPLRRSFLDSEIEQAQSLCRNPLDMSEVWGRFQTLARARNGPLYGVTPEGVQYIDPNDEHQTLGRRAFNARLKRKSRKDT